MSSDSKEGERDLLREVYEVFLESGDDWKTPLEIARVVFGEKATKKQVNPFLYELKSMGLIRRKTLGENGANPVWTLKYE